jgi:hypothetical protein
MNCSPLAAGWLAAWLLAGCAGSRPAGFLFLGVPENRSSEQGPVGLIQGEAVLIPNVTAVSETGYDHYLAAKRSGRIVAERNHAGHVYCAVKARRDVRFDDASAWVEVTERFRAKIP